MKTEICRTKEEDTMLRIYTLQKSIEGIQQSLENPRTSDRLHDFLGGEVIARRGKIEELLREVRE
jgi:hypothetical protein